MHYDGVNGILHMQGSSLIGKVLESLDESWIYFSFLHCVLRNTLLWCNNSREIVKMLFTCGPHFCLSAARAYVPSDSILGVRLGILSRHIMKAASLFSGCIIFLNYVLFFVVNLCWILRLFFMSPVWSLLTDVPAWVLNVEYRVGFLSVWRSYCMCYSGAALKVEHRFNLI